MRNIQGAIPVDLHTQIARDVAASDPPLTISHFVRLYLARGRAAVMAERDAARPKRLAKGRR